MNFVDSFEKTISDAITVDNDASMTTSPDLHGSPASSPYLASGGDFLHSGGPWSSPSPSNPDEKKKAATKGLPVGIGSAGSWAALMRSTTRGATKSPSGSGSGSSGVGQHEWGHDIGGTQMSPPLASSASNKGRTNSSSPLLDEDEPYAGGTPAAPTLLKPSTPKERILASRAKHGKRMSLPGPMLGTGFGLGLGGGSPTTTSPAAAAAVTSPTSPANSSSKQYQYQQRKPSPSTAKAAPFGFGLEEVAEEEDKAEAEDGWGW